MDPFGGAGVSSRRLPLRQDVVGAAIAAGCSASRGQVTFPNPDSGSLSRASLEKAPRTDTVLIRLHVLSVIDHHPVRLDMQ